MIHKTVGFGYSKEKKQHKSAKMIWILLIIVVLLIGGYIKFSPKALSFSESKVSIVKGDTITKFYDSLDIDDTQEFRLKAYIKRHPEALPNIQEGTYIFSGTYTKSEFFSHISDGPEINYISYTVLEGRSMYDIDADLSEKGYIEAGEYISYVTNPSKISELSERYDFFDSNLTSLEGFLYPDTYYLSNRDGLVKELVSMQLNAFKSKVWVDHISDFDNIKNTYGLSIYETVSLASIVEKEEKNNSNKSTVAGIFYNRLQNHDKLGADITLCYGLAKPYSECSTKVIVSNLEDSNNKYNTRMLAGLTPTPIGNPSVSTIEAVLFPQKTSYYFYLHDSNGQIHYAETSAEHSQNKSLYL